MAVVSVQERTRGERAWKDLNGRHYVRTYLVIVDDAADGPATVMDADDGSTAIPELGDAHPNNAYARARSVTPEQVKAEDRLKWLCRVSYDTTTRKPPKENPLREDPEISWGQITRTLAIVKDKDGVAILNSAYNPYDPPFEDEVHDLAVTIVRNVKTFTPSTADSYVDSVNSDSTTIAGLAVSARQAKLVQWTAVSGERNGIDFWRETYVIEFRAATWDLELLDHGLYYISGTDRLPILDDEKNPLTEPQRLDGSGGVLTPPTANSVFNTHRARDEKVFGSLGLNI